MSQVTIADIYWIMTFLATSKNEPNKRKTSLLVMPKTCLSRVSWELYFVKYKKSYKRRPLGLWLTWYSRSFFQFHVLQSFQASHNLRFSLSFVGLCDNFEFGIGGGHQEKRTKGEEEIHFTFFCIVVVLLCKVVVFCIFCWDPRFFSRAKTMKQMTWTPILLSATLVLLLGDNGKLFHFNYAHLPTWRMTHLERIFPLQLL